MAYSAIKYAADKLLEREQGMTLDEWLDAHGELATPILLVQLTIDTGGIVVVDRRTVSKWQAERAAA